MPKSILIVEDYETVARLVAFNLQRHGYSARTAASGELGLEAINTERPDLVILDLGLPDMDGLEFMQALWQRYPEASIPVIVLSARDERRSEAEAAELGVKAFLPKPVEPQELLQAVQQCIGEA